MCYEVFVVVVYLFVLFSQNSLFWRSSSVKLITEGTLFNSLLRKSGGFDKLSASLRNEYLAQLIFSKSSHETMPFFSRKDCSPAARRLLEMDLEISNYGQMTRTTPVLVPNLLTSPLHQRKDPIIHPTFIELAIYRRQHQQEDSSPFSTAFGSAPYSSTVGPFSCRPSRERSYGRPCEGGYQQSSVDREDHMVLTSTEIYSRAKELICRTWVVPPVHARYFQRHPGSAISFKGSRSYQTAFSRFSTGHLRCMNFEGVKRSFPICPKFNISPFSPQHILQCLGFSCEEAVASPCCP
ncbi:RNase H domain-containing protein [Trichonephila clavipes]|nr:RNase H domain-containing protein [Trichonephila clavipes]